MGKTLPYSGAEPRIELEPALQQADALLSHAAPYEPRRTLKPRRTIGVTPHRWREAPANGDG
jgi:hypothetical protein